MKTTYTLLLCLLSFEAFSQTNIYPTTESPTIYGYSPGLTLQRNTASGGYTQGIQTKLQNGDNNWFFGNLHDGQWMVAKGDYESPKLVVLSNGNVGVGTDNPQAKFEIQSPNSGWLLHSRAASPNQGDINGIKLYSGYLGDDKWAGVSSVAEDLHSNSTGLSLYTAQAERLRITGTGNVGIGTASPNAKLEISSSTDYNQLSLTKKTIEGQKGSGIVFRNLVNNGELSEIAGIQAKLLDGGAGSVKGSLSLYTKNDEIKIEAVTISSPGNMGIGTTKPLAKLHVNSLGSDVDGGNGVMIDKNALVVQASTGNRSTTIGPKIEFALPANTDGSNVYSQARIMAVAANSNSGDASGKMILGTKRYFNKLGTGPQWYFGNDLVIDGNGNIGVGTLTPNERLAVNGKIRAKEIKVEPTGWSDYVFEDDYKIASLAEIEKYIKVNKHLPEMPTAKEVAANGIELGEMNKLLLKKVEELTLLLIEQAKEVKQLRHDVKILKDKT